MAMIPTTTPHALTREPDWFHWLFLREDRAISCDLDVRNDGTYIVTIVPLWSPEDQVTEMFVRPADAVRWQETMQQRLHASGWLLADSGVVTNAA